MATTASRFNGANSNTASMPGKQRRAKVKATVAHTPVEPDPVTTYRAAADKFMASLDVPSLRRTIVATVIAIIAGAFTYAGCLQLAELAMIGAVTLGTPMFMLTVTAIISVAITVLASWLVTAKTFEIIVKADLSGLKTHVVSAWSSTTQRARRLFTRKMQS